MAQVKTEIELVEQVVLVLSKEEANYLHDNLTWILGCHEKGIEELHPAEVNFFREIIDGIESAVIKAPGE